MCMNISKEDILIVNKEFGGNLMSDSSIDFAINMQKNNKLGEYKKLAYLIRSIIVDHPFTDGNKRTAAFVALAFAEKFNKSVNKKILMKQIISIAKNNVINIRNIEWRLKNAIS